MYDVCALEGDRETLCQGVQAYAIACQHAGVQILPWRSASFCRESWPLFPPTSSFTFSFLTTLFSRASEVDIMMTFSYSCHMPS